jgi:hypothetical protein
MHRARAVSLGVAFGFILAACSSGSTTTVGSASDGGGAGGGGGACPNVAGMWTVKTHCDPSLVGDTMTVTQSNCSLTFSAPFNGFNATVTSDDKISVSGPQTCTGTASASSIAMTCTPGTCMVTLAR